MLVMYAVMGLLTAVAALVYTTRLNAATTSAGQAMEMDVIAACVIGGTSPAGGVGTIFGGIIGALVMASLDNGMSLLNLDIMYQYVIKGLVLLSPGKRAIDYAYYSSKKAEFGSVFKIWIFH